MSPLKPEFSGPTELTPLDRREFLTAMGLLTSMGVLASCGQKADHIYPFAEEKKEFSARDFEYYSSVIAASGFAQGLLLKSFQGRPIKVEGHPSHPFSRGATTPQAQAMLFDLYQPKRLQSSPEQWMSLAKELTHHTAGMVIWYRPNHSPSFQALLREVRTRFPAIDFISESPEKIERWNLIDASEADEVISFDTDLFAGRPDSLALARVLMDKRRRPLGDNILKGYTRFVSYHSSPNLFAAKANESHLQTPQEIWTSALKLRDQLKAKGVPKLKTAVFISRSLHPDALDLEAEINRLLGTPCRSQKFPLLQTLSLKDLETRLSEGRVKTLLTIDSDPLLWYPHLADKMKKVLQRIAAASMSNLTVEAASTKVALHHSLEYWSDLQAVDGSIAIQQPLIKPLFKGLDPYALIGALLGREVKSYEFVKARHATNWTKLLQGVPTPQLPDSFSRVTVPTAAAMSPGLLVKLVPDYALGMGESESNPLLQELPRPFSNLTWQNAYGLSAADAEKLKVKDGDVIELQQDSVKVSGPAVILPQIAPGVIVAGLGYGSTDRGTNNFALRSLSEVKVKKTLWSKKLARAQDDLSDKDHSPIQTTPIPAMKKAAVQPASLYPATPLPHQDKGPQWGMTIDLETCTGCQSCVIACQVENNVPFVGEDQVSKGRIMHWLRIDTYQVKANTFFQPVPCMHCEKAPCEVVCPVNATVHGNSGLNEMVYNRCVGTRYCSNNCPYRVRRFNFRAYSVLKYPVTLGLNPEVSVRDRGVMEKCTYCVQRLKTKDPTPACAQVCPTRAITFGDISDPMSEVAVAKASPRHYELLEGEGVRPRTTYLKVVQHD